MLGQGLLGISLKKSEKRRLSLGPFALWYEARVAVAALPILLPLEFKNRDKGQHAQTGRAERPKGRTWVL